MARLTDCKYEMAPEMYEEPKKIRIMYERDKKIIAVLRAKIAARKENLVC